MVIYNDLFYSDVLIYILKEWDWIRKKSKASQNNDMICLYCVHTSLIDECVLFGFNLYC